MKMNSNSMKNTQQGFTLIELLVVISIIGLLSSIVLASLSIARAKSRDAGRIQSILQLRTALELYKTTNGSYPVTGTLGDTANEFGNADYCGKTISNFANLFGSSGQIIPSFLRSFKIDFSNVDSCFIYQSDGANYLFQAYDYLENELSIKHPLIYKYTTNQNAAHATLKSASIFSDQQNSEMWAW